MLSFKELGVSKPVTDALGCRGIEQPFAVQNLVMPDVLSGSDVLVKSPTGSGKTLAFGIPTVEIIEPNDPRPSALILAPTRELALQIVEELSDIAYAKALSIVAVYGGAGIQKQQKLARRAHIVVATPGRLEDLLARRTFDLSKIKLLVLDEADRMLDMGFRPVVDRIVALTPDTRQTLFFSATLDGEVGRVAASYTCDAKHHEHIAPEESRGDIAHNFVRVEHDSKIERLISQLTDGEKRRTLVFVRTKRGAERLAKRLTAGDVEAVAMHGDKSQRQRERALARFSTGKVDTLVATDVAARGIDVDDVTHVINFDPPASHEDYVHRVGRTGRAGRSGIGVTYVAGDQARDMSAIVKRLKLATEFESAGFTIKTGGGSGGGGSRGRGPGRPGNGQRRRSSNGKASSSNGSSYSGGNSRKGGKPSGGGQRSNRSGSNSGGSGRRG